MRERLVWRDLGAAACRTTCGQPEGDACRGLSAPLEECAERVASSRRGLVLGTGSSGTVDAGHGQIMSAAGSGGGLITTGFIVILQG